MKGMSEDKIRNVIMKLVETHKERAWKNERETHYEFFRLLSMKFGPDDIMKNFRWEYPIKTPSYGKTTHPKPAAMDLAYITEGGFIGIEIELVSAGKGFEDEIEKCIEKFRMTDYLGNRLVKGFLVPLIDEGRRRNIRIETGVISYKEYFEIQFAKFRAEIKEKGLPVELITEGVSFRE